MPTVNSLAMYSSSKCINSLYIILLVMLLLIHDQKVGIQGRPGWLRAESGESEIFIGILADKLFNGFVLI